MHTTTFRIGLLAVLFHSLLIAVAPAMIRQKSSQPLRTIDLSKSTYKQKQLSGNIHKGQTHRYLLKGKAGQKIELLLKAQTRPKIMLYAKDGSVISENIETHYYELPRLEDYSLVVTPNDDPDIASRAGGHYMIFIVVRRPE